MGNEQGHELESKMWCEETVKSKLDRYRDISVMYKKTIGLGYSLYQTQLTASTTTLPAIGLFPQVCA